MHIFQRHNVTITGNVMADKTLVFAHGFGTDQSAWRFIIDGFADQYKIILYNNAGAGSLDPKDFDPAKYNSLHSYANDLLAIVQELRFSNNILIAHSVSSMIGLLAAIKVPEAFSKMVFIGASPRYLNDANYVGGFEQSDLDALYEQMTQNYHAWVNGFATAAMRNADNPSLAAEFSRTLNMLRPDIAVAVAKTIFQSDHRKELALFSREALIIQATNDIAVPMEVGEYLHKHIAHSQLVNIEAEGHFPHISAPQEVINCIRPFL